MQMIFQWIECQHPQIAADAHHCFNEGKRKSWEGKLMQTLGLRAGIPDIYIDYPTNKYHGLRIEVKEKNKSGRYGKPTLAQTRKIQRLNERGYFAKVCNGFDDTVNTITKYLKDEI